MAMKRCAAQLRRESEVHPPRAAAAEVCFEFALVRIKVMGSISDTVSLDPFIVTTRFRPAMKRGASRIASSVLVFLFCTVFAGFAAATDAEDEMDMAYQAVPFERGASSPPMVSVFYDLDYSGVGVEQPRTIIACIWPDGRVVWSGDRSKGGSPYFTARISPEQVRKLVAVFQARIFYQRKYWFEQAVDAPHHDVNIIDGTRRLAMCSSAGYSMEIKTPFLITNAIDALACFRQQLEQVLPREGEPLAKFDYEIRRLR